MLSVTCKFISYFSYLSSNSEWEMGENKPKQNTRPEGLWNDSEDFLCVMYVTAALSFCLEKLIWYFSLLFQVSVPMIGKKINWFS